MYLEVIFQFANMLKNGERIPVDKERAYYYKKEADLRHVNAMHNYATSLYMTYCLPSLSIKK